MKYTCYTDGGYDNVNKRNGYGSFRIKSDFDDTTIRHIYPTIQSSNEAEYQTFTDLLKFLIINIPEGSHNEVLIISDSRLLVNQVNCDWKVKAGNLVRYYKESQVLLAELSKNCAIKLIWMSRKVLVKELGH